MLKKPSPPAKGAGPSPGTHRPMLFSSWPLLWEFGTSVAYEDGSSRELPTLMFFLYEGRLTAALNDRDNSRTVFVSGSDPIGLLDALERGLADDDLQWRPNAQRKGQKNR